MRQWQAKVLRMLGRYISLSCSRTSSRISSSRVSWSLAAETNSRMSHIDMRGQNVLKTSAAMLSLPERQLAALFRVE